jgi:hypothetical protein
MKHIGSCASIFAAKGVGTDRADHKLCMLFVFKQPLSPAAVAITVIHVTTFI